MLFDKDIQFTGCCQPYKSSCSVRVMEITCNAGKMAAATIASNLLAMLP